MATRSLKATKKVASQSKKKTTKVKKARRAVGVKRAKAPLLSLKKQRTSVHGTQPLGHLLLEKKLKAAGFTGDIFSDHATKKRYSTDESIFSITPQLVLIPEDQTDIERAVQFVRREVAAFPALSLTPRAAGTGLSGGSLTDSIVLDVTTHLRHIGKVSTSKNGATITCGPGAMWRDVEEVLKTHGHYIPSFPASKDLCTIGGAVANNAAGPDSLKYGHTADWVASLDAVLHDGHTYTIAPMSYKELRTLMKEDGAYAKIAREVFALLESYESTINKAEPKQSKNSAGYALWDVLDVSMQEFKTGKKGSFDLTRLFSGSQGTIGIITSVTMKAIPIQKESELIVVPVFDLMDAGRVITRALKYNPRNVELFDGLTFNLALKHPRFFKDRLSKVMFYKVLLSMYTTFHVRWSGRTPEFTILITLDRDDTDMNVSDIVADLKQHHGKKARHVTTPVETEMFWQIRRASYTLSKYQNSHKRPAAFLEDMIVPPENLSKYFSVVKKLLQKYNVQAAVHGHGGNGHLHFYPLLDFTNDTTPKLISKMAEEFFSTAVAFGGSICGEHNDGIIRTPHLDKVFSKKMLQLFITLEELCDPYDIFNPGKKVHPRFSVIESIRDSN